MSKKSKKAPIVPSEDTIEGFDRICKTTGLTKTKALSEIKSLIERGYIEPIYKKNGKIKCTLGKKVFEN